MWVRMGVDCHALVQGGEHIYTYCWGSLKTVLEVVAVVDAYERFV